VTAAALDMSHDWLDRPLPQNIEVAANCFVESTHVFGMFHSRRQPGLTMGTGSGLYNQSQLVVGEQGRVVLGDYACINGCAIQCEDLVEIGNYCLISWATTISDCIEEVGLRGIAPDRLTAALRGFRPPRLTEPRPVVLEDNVWLGFGAVVMPGVRIGRNSIIGAKTVVREDVPANVVYAGSPGRVVRRLENSAMQDVAG